MRPVTQSICLTAILLAFSACSPPAETVRRDCSTGQDCGLAYTGDVCGDCRCESTAVNVEEIPGIVARNEAEAFCPFRDTRIICDCFPTLVPYCADDGCRIAFPDEVPEGADVRIDECVGISFQCDPNEDSDLISQIESELGQCDLPVNGTCHCEAAFANADHCVADLTKITEPILEAINSDRLIRCHDRCRE